MLEQTDLQDLFGLCQHIYKLKSMNYLISTYLGTVKYIYGMTGLENQKFIVLFFVMAVVDSCLFA